MFRENFLVLRLPSSLALADREKWAHPTHIFDHTVRVPKVTALRSADSVRLLAVRDGEQGQSYRNFRNEWVITQVKKMPVNFSRQLTCTASAIRDVAEGPRVEIRGLCSWRMREANDCPRRGRLHGGQPRNTGEPSPRVRAGHFSSWGWRGASTLIKNVQKCPQASDTRL